MKKLLLGCGISTKAGYVNVDLKKIPGANPPVDEAWNLENFPWAFAEDNEYDVIELPAVLEYLYDAVKTMDEVWRIAKPGATIKIILPFYNSVDWGTDFTHRHSCTQRSMDYLDPRTKIGREMGHFTDKKFHVVRKDYYTVIWKWIKVENRLGKRWLDFWAFFLCNVIRDIEFELKKLPA